MHKLMVILKSTLITALYVVCSGCAWMFPYDQEFNCPRGENSGECVNSMEAYERASTGVSKHRKRSETVAKEEAQVQEEPVFAPHDTGYRNYVDANYDQVAKLLTSPTTPMVTMPEIMEILILNRQSENSKTIYGGRWVHVIVEDSKFVIGDYLKPKRVPLNSYF